MPCKIRVLDEHTINKIAAGEVIENPASVVKELVENAIDAGASEICVEIRGGGRQLIRITDNGCGMNPDDALLCLERHATSKIKQVEDIAAIGTMGFRGEAIPSIAAISKFTIMTSSKEGPEGQGTMVVVEGGKIIKCTPIVRSAGTTIEVKTLFFNVPVRRKFQKSPAYDQNEIEKVLNNIALGYPEIQFQLIGEQKTLLKTPQVDDKTFEGIFRQRVKDILGHDFCSESVYVQSEKKEFTVKGFIGVPSAHRHNRSGQYLFVNQRAISSPLISYAIREGYGHVLPAQRHPIFALHLSLAGDLVDVNVHPQKKEVRFRREQELKESLIQVVREAVQKGFSDVALQETKWMVPLPWERAESFCPPMPDLDVSTLSVPEVVPPAKIELKQEPEKKEVRFQENLVLEKKSLPRILGVIKGYILIESLPNRSSTGVCLVDQRAAHARVLFEQILKGTDQAAQQALLVPYSFQTSQTQEKALLENLESLHQLGISIRQSGPKAFLLDAIAPAFEKIDLTTFIQELLTNLADEVELSAIKQEKIKKVAMMASRVSINKNATLSFLEAEKLFQQLMECQMPYQCPSGHPTMANITDDELSRRFKA